MERPSAAGAGRVIAALWWAFLLGACDGPPEVGPAAAVAVAASGPVSLADLRPLVQRADSLERAASWLPAADAWRDAAAAAPSLRHWFLLKAASAQPDARTRERWLRELTLPSTADTAAWPRRLVGAHLRALLRHGDTTEAVQRYLSLGNVRDSVVGLSLRVRQGRELSDAERLALARGALHIGDIPLARREYGVLVREGAGGLSAQDHYDHGVALFNAGVYEMALAAFGRAGGDYAGRAAYQRARALLRLGQAGPAVSALREVTVRHVADTVAAGLAWYLLGDLATDANRDAEALSAWRTLVARYPTHALAPRAAFRAAMVQVAAGDWPAVQRQLAPLLERLNDERLAARYWIGRAHAAQGRRRRADSLWRALVTDAPDSYYAWLAAQRLGTVPWRAATDDGSRGPRAAADAHSEGRGGAEAAERLTSQAITDALTRAAWLDSLALVDEARDERADLMRAAAFTAADARRVAQALLREELASPAMTLAARQPGLVQSGDPADQRLRFPLPFADRLAAHAASAGLERAFVAALIRQESRFTRTARSGAGALGLMQVMPAVGRSLARSAGLEPWHDTLLFVPDINLQLGTRHLAAALRRNGEAHPAYALAAYNAGHTRLARWRAKRGAASDWELFVERIPFVETRDYVRIVLRNAEWYRVLYDE